MTVTALSLSSFLNNTNDSPVLTDGLRAGLYNSKPSGLPTTENNMEYRNLKSFNWIADKLGNDTRSQQKLERPCTRGGDSRGLDFSFIGKTTL